MDAARNPIPDVLMVVWSDGGAENFAGSFAFLCDFVKKSDNLRVLRVAKASDGTGQVVWADNICVNPVDLKDFLKIFNSLDMFNLSDA